MDPTISIAVYEIVIKGREPKTNHSSPVTYASLGRNETYPEFIEGMIQRTLNRFYDGKDQKEIAKLSSLVDRGMSRSGEHLDGFIDYGRYGGAADIINTENNYTKDFAMGPAHAPVTPYYFYFHLPSDQTAAIMCIQRLGNSGIYSILKEHLEKEFKDCLPDGHTVSIDKLVPSEYIEQVSKKAARVTAIHLSYELDSEQVFNSLDEQVGERKVKERKIEVQQNLKIKGLIRARAEDFLENYSLKKPEFYKEIGLDPENTTIKERISVKFGRKTFKMTTGDDAKDLAAYFDVSDDVGLKNGHPDAKKLKAAVKDIMKVVEQKKYGKSSKS
jgi:hypothetical protein